MHRHGTPWRGGHAWQHLSFIGWNGDRLHRPLSCPLQQGQNRARVAGIVNLKSSHRTTINMGFESTTCEAIERASCETHARQATLWCWCKPRKMTELGHPRSPNWAHHSRSDTASGATGAGILVESEAVPALTHLWGELPPPPRCAANLDGATGAWPPRPRRPLTDTAATPRVAPKDAPRVVLMQP